MPKPPVSRPPQPFGAAEPSDVHSSSATRLADRAYDQLREFIAHQALQLGDRLPSENELCGRLDVSRTVVREALARLQADGLVESRRGAGSYVLHRLVEREIGPPLEHAHRRQLDALEVRITLASLAARLAAEHRTANELQAIEHCVAQLVASMEANAPSASLDRQFHGAIATASHNPMIGMTFVALDLATSCSVAGPFPWAPSGKPNPNDYLAIVEAIGRREGAIAEAAMRLHLLATRRRLIGSPTSCGKPDAGNPR